MSTETSGPESERRVDEVDGAVPVDETDASAEAPASEPESAASKPDPIPEPAELSVEEPPLPEPTTPEPEPVVESAPAVAAESAVETSVVDAEAAETEAAAASEARAKADLDAAVARASEFPEPEDDAVATDALPAPVAADSVRRETYVPPVAGATAVGAAVLAEPPLDPAAGYVPQTIYVQAPAPPRNKGNRGFGVLVALLGTVAFAALYIGIAYLLFLGQGGSAAAAEGVGEFVVRWVFWAPTVAFFIGFAILAAIVNRGPYWTYAVFGILVGVFVYFAYVGGSLLTVQAWTLTFEQAQAFIGARWTDPLAIVAAVLALEIPIWLGGWIAARGRAVAARNREALEAYDRELAAGPQLLR